MIEWGSAVARAGLFAGVMPRAVASSRAASHGDTALGIPPSEMAPRVVGETALDEFFIAINSVLRTVPSVDTLRANVDRAAAAADDLSALGVGGVHVAQPAPRVINRRRRRIGATAYHHIDFSSSELTLPGPLAAADRYAGSTSSARVVSGGGVGRRWLIWVHGAAQGRSDDLYAFRAAHLHSRLGYNVVFPVLPAHGDRRHRSVAYPGFDPLQNVAITVRAIAEIRALVSWIKTHDPIDITIAGTSLGGPLAAMVAGLEPDVDSVLAVVPMLDMHATLAHHMERGGRRGRASADLLRTDAVTAVTAVIDPLAVMPYAAPERRMVIAALNDRVTWVTAAQRLHDHWQGRIHWYPGGHVGHALSGQVRSATDEFLSS